jgi:hypothetical protein
VPPPHRHGHNWALQSGPHCRPLIGITTVGCYSRGASVAAVAAEVRDGLGMGTTRRKLLRAQSGSTVAGGHGGAGVVMMWWWFMNDPRDDSETLALRGQGAVEA